jgi:tRNA/rRNA methyltransferase
MLRRIFGRAGLTPREVQTLRGIIRKTERKMGYVLKESEAQETEASESMEKFI